MMKLLPDAKCAFCGEPGLVGSPSRPERICDACLASCCGAIARAASATAGSGAAKEPSTCTFCGREEDDVYYLVRGKGVAICDGCVAEAVQLTSR
jgi:hypothetical protein